MGARGQMGFEDADATMLHRLLSGLGGESGLSVDAWALGAVGHKGITWPSLQQLDVNGMQPGDAARLLAAAFHSCPRLSLNNVTLNPCVPPKAASSAAAITDLCQRLAAMPGQLECMSILPLQRYSCEMMRSRT